MGSFDGAESTDLVGLFLLNQLKKVKVQGHAINIGLYRDDALLVSRLTTRQTAKLVDDLVKVLKHPYGLTVTIDANHKIIDFLDVKFNLNTGLFQPYQKPNNKILYVHSKSNHPPATTKKILPLIVILEHECQFLAIFKDGPTFVWKLLVGSIIQVLLDV